MSRFLPADHAKGDEGTVGGYAAVHARPVALEGSDGMPYSVELMTDASGDVARPYGAYFLFVRWRRVGEAGVEGHLESEFLAWGADREAAKATLGAFPIEDVQRVLDALIRGEARA
jgi:hypothetical protein